jgi:hypothetical protein
MWTTAEVNVKRRTTPIGEYESAFGVMSFFFDTSQKKKTGEVWQRESLRPFGVSFHEKKKFSRVKSPRQNLLEKKTGLDLFLSHSRA